MCIDRALFWEDLFLYFFESKYVQNFVSKKSNRACKYHATSRFIDDEFSKSFKCIYPEEFALKQEHSGTHATFLELYIETDGIFVYKLFDKRDKFSFFVVHMPHFQNIIPSTIFYGSIF